MSSHHSTGSVFDPFPLGSYYTIPVLPHRNSRANDLISNEISRPRSLPLYPVSTGYAAECMAPGEYQYTTYPLVPPNDFLTRSLPAVETRPQADAALFPNGCDVFSADCCRFNSPMFNPQTMQSIGLPCGSANFCPLWLNDYKNVPNGCRTGGSVCNRTTVVNSVNRNIFPDVAVPMQFDQYYLGDNSRGTDYCSYSADAISGDGYSSFLRQENDCVDTFRPEGCGAITPVESPDRRHSTESQTLSAVADYNMVNSDITARKTSHIFCDAVPARQPPFVSFHTFTEMHPLMFSDCMPDSAFSNSSFMNGINSGFSGVAVDNSVRHQSAEFRDAQPSTWPPLPSLPVSLSSPTGVPLQQEFTDNMNAVSMDSAFQDASLSTSAERSEVAMDIASSGDKQTVADITTSTSFHTGTVAQLCGSSSAHDAMSVCEIRSEEERAMEQSADASVLSDFVTNVIFETDETRKQDLVADLAPPSVCENKSSDGGMTRHIAGDNFEQKFRDRATAENLETCCTSPQCSQEDTSLCGTTGSKACDVPILNESAVDHSSTHAAVNTSLNLDALEVSVCQRDSSVDKEALPGNGDFKKSDSSCRFADDSDDDVIILSPLPDESTQQKQIPDTRTIQSSNQAESLNLDSFVALGSLPKNAAAIAAKTPNNISVIDLSDDVIIVSPPPNEAAQQKATEPMLKANSVSYSTSMNKTCHAQPPQVRLVNHVDASQNMRSVLRPVVAPHSAMKLRSSSFNAATMPVNAVRPPLPSLDHEPFSNVGQFATGSMIRSPQHSIALARASFGPSQMVHSRQNRTASLPDHEIARRRQLESANIVLPTNRHVQDLHSARTCVSSSSLSQGREMLVMRKAPYRPVTGVNSTTACRLMNTVSHTQHTTHNLTARQVDGRKEQLTAHQIIQQKLLRRRLSEVEMLRKILARKAAVVSQAATHAIRKPVPNGDVAQRRAALTNVLSASLQPFRNHTIQKVVYHWRPSFSSTGQTPVSWTDCADHSYAGIGSRSAQHKRQMTLNDFVAATRQSFTNRYRTRTAPVVIDLTEDDTVPDTCEGFFARARRRFSNIHRLYRPRRQLIRKTGLSDGSCCLPKQLAVKKSGTFCIDKSLPFYRSFVQSLLKQYRFGSRGQPLRLVVSELYVPPARSLVTTEQSRKPSDFEAMSSPESSQPEYDSSGSSDECQSSSETCSNTDRWKFLADSKFPIVLLERLDDCIADTYSECSGEFDSGMLDLTANKGDQVDIADKDYIPTEGMAEVTGSPNLKATQPNGFTMMSVKENVRVEKPHDVFPELSACNAVCDKVAILCRPVSVVLERLDVNQIEAICRELQEYGNEISRSEKLHQQQLSRQTPDICRSTPRATVRLSCAHGRNSDLAASLKVVICRRQLRDRPQYYVSKEASAYPMLHDKRISPKIYKFMRCQSVRKVAVRFIQYMLRKCRHLSRRTIEHHRNAKSETFLEPVPFKAAEVDDAAVAVAAMPENQLNLSGEIVSTSDTPVDHMDDTACDDNTENLSAPPSCQSGVSTVDYLSPCQSPKNIECSDLMADEKELLATVPLKTALLDDVSTILEPFKFKAAEPDNATVAAVEIPVDTMEFVADTAATFAETQVDHVDNGSYGDEKSENLSESPSCSDVSTVSYLSLHLSTKGTDCKDIAADEKELVLTEHMPLKSAILDNVSTTAELITCFEPLPFKAAEQDNATAAAVAALRQDYMDLVAENVATAETPVDCVDPMSSHGDNENLPAPLSCQSEVFTIGYPSPHQSPKTIQYNDRTADGNEPLLTQHMPLKSAASNNTSTTVPLFISLADTLSFKATEPDNAIVAAVARPEDSINLTADGATRFAETLAKQEDDTSCDGDTENLSAPLSCQSDVSTIEYLSPCPSPKAIEFDDCTTDGKEYLCTEHMRLRSAIANNVPPSCQSSIFFTGHLSAHQSPEDLECNNFSADRKKRLCSGHMPLKSAIPDNVDTTADLTCCLEPLLATAAGEPDDVTVSSVVMPLDKMDLEVDNTATAQTAVDQFDETSYDVDTENLSAPPSCQSEASTIGYLSPHPSPKAVAVAYNDLAADVKEPLSLTSTLQDDASAVAEMQLDDTSCDCDTVIMSLPQSCLSDESTIGYVSPHHSPRSSDCNDLRAGGEELIGSSPLESDALAFKFGFFPKEGHCRHDNGLSDHQVFAHAATSVEESDISSNQCMGHGTNFQPTTNDATPHCGANGLIDVLSTHSAICSSADNSSISRICTEFAEIGSVNASYSGNTSTDSQMENVT